MKEYTQKEINEAQLKMIANIEDIRKKARFRYDLYNSPVGKINCGHDFWAKAKDLKYGQIIQCTVCKQWFVKAYESAYVSGDDSEDHISKSDCFHRISLGYRE